MKHPALQSVAVIVIVMMLLVAMCAFAVSASDDVAPAYSETVTTTTAVACYATQLEYDTSPMIVGETRAIRFYHPANATAFGCSFESVSENIKISYEEGDTVLYVTALAEGDASLYIRESNCAFGAYAYLTVAKAGDVNADGAVNTLDVMTLYHGVSGNIVFTDAQRKIGDLDGDDQVGMLDVMALFITTSGQA